MLFLFGWVIGVVIVYFEGGLWFVFGSLIFVGEGSEWCVYMFDE